MKRAIVINLLEGLFALLAVLLLSLYLIIGWELVWVAQIFVCGACAAFFIEYFLKSGHQRIIAVFFAISFIANALSIVYQLLK